MMPSEKILQRTAEKLVASLVKNQLLVAKQPEAEIAKRVTDTMKKNFQEEAAIGRDAERILEENRRQTGGMDQRALLFKIREKLARERGFVL